MSRPPRNLDIDMIEAGKMILSNDGMNALTIQNVCSLANVNKGTFVYYFSSKKNFFLTILKNINQEFLDFLNKDLDIFEAPVLELRHCINKMLEFAEGKEKLILTIFYDLLLNKMNLRDAVILNFVENHILIGIIEKCQENGDFSTELPPFEIFSMIILGGFQPSISVLNNKDVSVKRRAEFRKERVNIILHGLLIKGETE